MFSSREDKAVFVVSGVMTFWSENGDSTLVRDSSVAT
jgi:hypothetical protein